MMEGHGQRPHSPALFCFTPHTHAHCPSIAYWITSNHPIKVTWSSSICCLGPSHWILDNGRCVVVRGKFQNKMSEMLALWQTSESLAAISFVWRQLWESTTVIEIKRRAFFCNHSSLSINSHEWMLQISFFVSDLWIIELCVDPCPFVGMSAGLH